MNRRTVLAASLFAGALAPVRLIAQQVKGKDNPTDAVPIENRRPKTNAEDVTGRASTTVVEPPTEEPKRAPAENEAILPENFPGEAGHKFRAYDISRYTSLPHSQPNPQTGVVDWIVRRTRESTWHGETLSAVCADRNRVRAYQSPKVLEQISELVERFTNATADFLAVRVRFVAAADTRWRYAVYSRLTSVGSGPQGQQIWTLKLEDAAMVLAQLQIDQRFRVLADQRVEMINGQSLNINTAVKRNYVAGLQREGAVGFGFQPNVQQLEEGVSLRLSPLLNFDGDAVDAMVDMRVNSVQSLIRTKIIAPREVGPNEMTIDVPEVIETRLEQTVNNWQIGQTLLIAAGIHPSILQSKGGIMNFRIPGTARLETELLVFLDVETVNRSRLTRSRD